MRSTGIQRKVDDLGRVVIPAGIRRTLEIREGDSVEIHVDGHRVVLEKSVDRCVFCGEADGLQPYRQRLVCQACVAAIGLLDEDLRRRRRSGAPREVAADPAGAAGAGARPGQQAPETPAGAVGVKPHTGRDSPATPADGEAAVAGGSDGTGQGTARPGGHRPRPVPGGREGQAPGAARSTGRDDGAATADPDERDREADSPASTSTTW